MTTATQYDALNLFEQLVNNVFQPHACEAPQRSPQQAAEIGSDRGAASAGQARQETRLVRMDVSETDQSYRVSAEFPGIKKELIEIMIEGKHVFLQAQATLAQAADGSAGRSLLNERFAGKLSRRIQLQQEIDSTAATASFADGVLQLTLPKKLAAMRKLEIQ
jgi:HSP20 family protein